MATKKRKAKRKAKRKMVRIKFKPARAPKWWPRDDKGKACFVGVTCSGYGWAIGQGDPVEAKFADIIMDNFRIDYGPKTRFEVEVV